MRSRPRARDSEASSLQDVYFGLKRHDSEQEWAQTMEERNKKVKEVSESLDMDDDKLMDPTSQLFEKDSMKPTDEMLTEKEKNFYNSIMKFVNVPREQRPVFATFSRFESNLPEDFPFDRRLSIQDDNGQGGVNKFNRQSFDDFKHTVAAPVRERQKSIVSNMFVVHSQTFDSPINGNKAVPAKKQPPHATPNSDFEVTKPANNDNSKGSKYKSFLALHSLLKKHFKGQEISDKDTKLSGVELSVLKSILQRKYKSKVNLNSKTPPLKEKLISITKLGSNKRPEENYKFIFKRCLKQMKDRLDIQTDKKNKRKEQEKLFYEHYFKKIAEGTGLSLQQFFHPKNSKSKYKDAPKTINSEYICNISKSTEFVHDFLEYMRNHLMADYEKTIDTKIDGLIKKWNDIFEKSEDKNRVIYEISEYIEKNKKCKLPWSDTEIREATLVVDKLFAENS